MVNKNMRENVQHHQTAQIKRWRVHRAWEAWQPAVGSGSWVVIFQPRMEAESKMVVGPGYELSLQQGSASQRSHDHSKNYL